MSQSKKIKAYAVSNGYDISSHTNNEVVTWLESDSAKYVSRYITELDIINESFPGDSISAQVMLDKLEAISTDDNMGKLVKRVLKWMGPSPRDGNAGLDIGDINFRTLIKSLQPSVLTDNEVLAILGLTTPMPRHKDAGILHPILDVYIDEARLI